MLKLILLFGGIGFLLFSKTGVALKKLIIDISELRFHTFNIRQATLKLSLLIKNPNSKSVLIQEVTAELYNSSGKLIGQVYETGLNITIPGKYVETPINNITVVVDTLKISDSFLDTLLGNSNELLKIKGFVKADGIKYNFSESVNVNTKK